VIFGPVVSVLSGLINCNLSSIHLATLLSHC